MVDSGTQTEGDTVPSVSVSSQTSTGSNKNQESQTCSATRNAELQVGSNPITTDQATQADEEAR